jgi:hypothetical protein
MANRRLYVKKLIKALILPAMLVVCIAQASWAAPPTGGSMSGTVAEYNAAQVHENNGLLTVPSGDDRGASYLRARVLPVP